MAKCPICGSEVDRIFQFDGNIVGCKYCGSHEIKPISAEQITSCNIYKALYMVIDEAQEWVGSFDKPGEDVSYINGAYDMAKKLLQIIEEQTEDAR